ncbi:MAG TPA: PDC sensor domain-containing protein [Candidatus Bathyarchaeia archaeon]
MAKTKLLIILVTVIMVISIGFNAYQWNQNLSLTKQSNEKEMPLILIQSEAAINAELLKLDRLLSNACQQLSTTGLTGPAAENILNSLHTENPDIITNAATADKNGILLAVQSSEYGNITGQNVGYQEQYIEMHKTMRPALSNLISLVEGFPGIVMVSPVFDTNKKLIGSLSIVFQPYQLIHPIVKDSTKGIYTIYALQKNSTLIYDANLEEQGRNIFTDEEYAGHTELQTFIHQVLDTQSGYGTYSYYDDLAASRPLVNKEAYWTTIGIHNTDWRLVIARNL